MESSGINLYGTVYLLGYKGVIKSAVVRQKREREREIGNVFPLIEMMEVEMLSCSPKGTILKRGLFTALEEQLLRKYQSIGWIPN